MKNENIICPKCGSDQYIYLLKDSRKKFGLNIEKGQYGCLDCANAWSDNSKKVKK